MKITSLLLAIAGLAVVAFAVALVSPFAQFAAPAFLVAGAAFFALLLCHDYAARRPAVCAGLERLPYAA